MTWSKALYARTSSLLLISVLFAGAAFSQERPKRRASNPSAAKPGEVRYKGILEPVSYTEDIKLTSVDFVSPEEGWAAGANGTIIHTKDAGKTWEAQLGGDPNAEGPEIGMIRFLDATHGWAAGGTASVIQRKLLGTSDGQTWREVGTVGTELQGVSDFTFISPTTGFFVEASTGGIYRTDDGGRTWKQVHKCAAKVQVGGVYRNVACNLRSISFVSPQVGFAVGAGGYGVVFVIRTDDGGATWSNAYVGTEVGHTDESHFKQHVAFVNENTGFVVLSRAEKLLATGDGGKTWDQLPVAAEGSVKFADPNVGWIIEDRSFIYTTDGGKRWTSRPIRFPAYVNAFTVPKSNRGYVVGDHGMVFRYSVVKDTYKSVNSIDAPATGPPN